jgi:hypothetical protein
MQDTPNILTDPRLALPEGILRGPDGQPFAVPPEGALGLLALGWVGLRVWRDKREAGGWAPATLVREEKEEKQEADKETP